VGGFGHPPQYIAVQAKSEASNVERVMKQFAGFNFFAKQVGVEDTERQKNAHQAGGRPINAFRGRSFSSDIKKVPSWGFSP
jgi:hypothetical protein